MHYKSFVTFLRAEKESYVIMYLKYLNYISTMHMLDFDFCLLMK